MPRAWRCAWRRCGSSGRSISQPRRTIRIGLWSGEEQGLLGSKAYVAQHFGYYTNLPRRRNAPLARSATQPSHRRAPGPTYQPAHAGSPPGIRPPFRLLQPGQWRRAIRGIYLQGNEPLRRSSGRWLEPLRDAGRRNASPQPTRAARTTSPSTPSGCPGFQFIQDPIDYIPHLPYDDGCARARPGGGPAAGRYRHGGLRR